MNILDTIIEDDASDATHPVIGVVAEEQDLLVEEPAPVFSGSRRTTHWCCY